MDYLVPNYANGTSKNPIDIIDAVLAFIGMGNISSLIGSINTEIQGMIGQVNSYLLEGS